ncbi:Cell wall-associated hydrolase, NlpC family [Nocardioides terrae]|uniref:Cell wall-associated hydrolase, NlpC family n=1 Tax=Nocardioides terrae TaxID=574651 RepID=A0A1I1I9I5_9ACTN|nr:C40 family peptidase [Nocardioides terrae]SFC32896.1 Cell wall-associated hydrolase, NlpC family [Nocardioides terrae]
MSIATVTDRIQQIQSQISQLQTTQGSDPTSAAAFATTLDEASATGDVARVSATDPTAATAVTDPTSTVAPTTSQKAVVDEAKQYLGLPYVWGGTSKSKGVDCSGLVQSVYKSLGYDLPRLSADQARSGRPVASMADAQPGDLIAWNNSSRNSGADHIAIYIGNGKMIEAPHTGAQVRLADVPSTPDYIRRILPDSVNGPASRAGLDASRASFDLQSLRSAAEKLPGGAS